MRMAISRLTSEVSARGAKDGVSIAPGGQVDLDSVIGEHPAVTDGDKVISPARPMTVADALGDELVALFELVGAPASGQETAADSASARGTRARRGAEEKE